MPYIPIALLVTVLVLTAIRRIGRLRFSIWQIMCCAALLSILTGSIGVRAALASIDLDVMLFLLGMFVVGAALERSGVLDAVVELDVLRRLDARENLSESVRICKQAGSRVR